MGRRGRLSPALWVMETHTYHCYTVTWDSFSPTNMEYLECSRSCLSNRTQRNIRLAKKFIQVFSIISCKNPNELFGQPNVRNDPHPSPKLGWTWMGSGPCDVIESGAQHGLCLWPVEECLSSSTSSLPLPPKWSDQISCSVLSHSLQPHESQHARPPCPSPTPGVHWDSRPSSQWCHPAISSSVVPFSSCPQSLPASESFPMIAMLFSLVADVVVY